MKKVWAAIVVFAVLLVLVDVKALCHECLNLPVAVVCERRQAHVDARIESNRTHGSIERSEFAGCQWYWHENPQ